MLDNHDSFTYNLYQYFGELGEDIIVTADSKPEAEYNETLDKAKALFRVLKGRLN